LRPEFVESAYYLFKATGSSRYRDMGLHFFNNLKEYARTDIAYATLKSVKFRVRVDQLESFFFSETMKYLYLLFAEKSIIDTQKMVFNTEAHPFCKIEGCFKT